jgi:flagellar L-ring protein FlgH
MLAKLLPVLLVAPLLGACAAMERLQNVGQAPALTPITNPQTQAGYRPVQMPMPPPQPGAASANSLWRSGARAFFKDQRAVRVGDLVTVRVRVTDRAQFQNQTTRSRRAGEEAGVGAAVGLQNLIRRLPEGPNNPLGALGPIDPENLVATNSNSTLTGTGQTNRQEQITTNVAAVVMQVLPNGNLVIEGRQEVRVNFEVRELIVAGIVRPEDIEAGNEIDSTRIAEARIAYGGRGQLTDVQQPRYGQQIMDIILPF